MIPRPFPRYVPTPTLSDLEEAQRVIEELHTLLKIMPPFFEGGEFTNYEVWEKLEAVEYLHSLAVNVIVDAGDKK